MADESFVQLPQDSVGKKLRTKKQTVSGNLVEEQIIRLLCHEKAELPLYGVVINASAAGANKYHFSLANTSGTNKWVEIVRIIVGNAASSLVLKLIRGTGDVSGGTDLTAYKFRSDNADLPAGVHIQNNAGPAAEDAGPLATGSGLASYTLWKEELTDQPFLLKEGEAFTVKQNAAASSGYVDVTCIFRIRDKET